MITNRIGSQTPALMIGRTPRAKIITPLACLIILIACFSAAGQDSAASKLKPVQLNGKWGYCDESGKMMIPAKFDDARTFSEGLAAVAIGNNARSEDIVVLELMGEYLKWGFIDETGKLVIPAKYYGLDDFSEGLAGFTLGSREVCRGGKWGFIDRFGSVVIKPRYESVDPFRNGRAKVSIGHLRCDFGRRSVVQVEFYGKHGYIDKRAKFTRTSEKERYAHF